MKYYNSNTLKHFLFQEIEVYVCAHSDLFDISVMSSDAVKKRKPKVIRSEGGTPEAKRGRGESDQVSGCEML